MCKFNDGVGVMLGHAVVGEQGVLEETKHAPLRSPIVQEQRGRCVVAYPYHLGTAVRKSRIQLQRELLSPRVLSVTVVKVLCEFHQVHILIQQVYLLLCMPASWE